MSKTTGIAEQILSLPKGGGTIQGLGEKFKPDLHMGTGVYNIPLDIPNGPNDIAPKLNLSYNTASGNGPFGMGFSLNLLAISRSTNKCIPNYTDSDTLVLEGAGKMLEISEGVFRVETDPYGWRIERCGSGFMLTDQNGVKYKLGTTEQSRLFKENNNRTETFRWLLEETEDSLGYKAVFEYIRDGGNLYIKKISYSIYSIEFNYEKRNDSVINSRAGFSIITNLRCSSIDLNICNSENPLIRKWIFTYEESSPGKHSLLHKVELKGFDDEGNSESLPVLTLDYTSFGSPQFTKFRGELSDVLPDSYDDGRRELVDFNGDGLPDLMEIRNGRAVVWENKGNCVWSRPHSKDSFPLPVELEGQSVAFADMEGNGTADLLFMDRPLSGYYPLLPGGGFGKPVLWRHSPHSKLSDPSTRLLDLNGDGITDLLCMGKDYYCLYYRDKEKGWIENPVTLPKSLFPPVDINDDRVYFADMTGDGLQDIVKVDGSGVRFWPYLGNGIWGKEFKLKNSVTIPNNFIPQRMFLADIDGDGCSDLIYVDSHRVLCWINTAGSQLSEPIEIFGTPLSDATNIRIADMKGAGTPGVLWSYTAPGSRKTDYFYLDISGGSKPYLLNSIDNGMGLKTSISYSVSTLERQRDVFWGKPWNTFLPFPMQVVSSIVSADTVTGVQTVNRYLYHDGHYEGSDMEFAGFGSVEVIEEGDDSVPSMITRNHHHLGCDEKGTLIPLSQKEKFQLKCLRGKLLKTEVCGLDKDGKELLYYTTENKWDTKALNTADGREFTVPLLIETRTMHFDKDAEVFRINSTENLEFDKYGNVLLQQQKAYNPLEASDRKILNTRIFYAVSNEERFVNKPSRVIQTDESGKVVSLTLRYYDNMPEGLVGVKGLITNQEFLALDDETIQNIYSEDIPDFESLGYHRKDGEEGWWAFGTSYQTEDIEGVYTGRVINSFGDITEIIFGSNRIYPKKVLDAMGNSITASYDPRANKLKTLTDANGCTVEEKYDSLGRLLYTVEPEANAQYPTVKYKYITDSLPVCILTENRLVNNSPETVCHKLFLDGSGNIIEERIIREDHEFVQKSYVMSGRGLIKEQFLPFIAAGKDYQKPQDVKSIKLVYDAIGRPLKVTNADGTVRSMEYFRNTVYVYDEEDNREEGSSPHSGTPQKNVYDATGRICEVSLNLSNRFISTKYTYDIKGDLIGVYQPEGRKTTFVYDLSGNTIAVISVQTGKTVFVNDATGIIREKRNAKGDKVLFNYDSLGRLKEIRDGKSPEPTAQYTYHDTNNPCQALSGNLNYALGRAVRIVHQGGEEIFEYDELGRIIKKTIWSKHLPSNQLVFDYCYRADGQFSSITYPALSPGSGRRKVIYEYDREGRLLAIPGFVSRISYNARGQRTEVLYNNGVRTVYTYDDRNFRLISSVTEDPNGNLIDEFIYQYDFVGNIVKIDSRDDRISTAYSYDDLYRLTGAVTKSGLSWTYEYNDLSDITFKSDIGELLYDSNGNVCKAGNDSFVFNKIGQLSSSSMGEFSYDSSGKLISAVKGNERMDMTYDHHGRRISLSYKSPDKTTDILTPDEMISIEDNIMYILIFDGNQCVARVREDDGATVYLHQNHLGSTSKVTAADGSILQSVYYDPFGAIIENTVAVSTNEVRILFAGNEYDFFTGLLYMSSRYYCPKIARFITPDTIVPDLYNPMAWNRYSYVLNNPLKYTDSTGHFWEEIGNWFKDNWKVIVAAVAVVAVIVISIVTFGVGLIGVGALVAVGVGMAIGGVVGGIAASQAGGDVLLGVLSGIALGGAASLAGTAIGAGMTAMMGKGLAATLLSGTLSGAVTGSAMGLAAGFAGGAGTGSQIWDKVWKGALTGAITGFLFSLGAYGFQNNWFSGPKISIQKPNIDNPKVLLAKAAKNLGESQNIGSALSTVAKEVGKSMINTSSGYPILNLIFGEIAAPICQTLIDSSASGIIVLDYGDDIWELLKEAGVKIKKEFKF